jgi:prepilin-type N-terminal cleavage/methylation domain-containing protein
MEMKKNQKGFTLFEVLIVLLLLGILAGIAIARVSSSQDTAKIKAVDQLVNVLNTHESGQYAEAWMQNDGAFIDASDVADQTYDVAKLEFWNTDIDGYQYTVPLLAGDAAAGVAVTYKGGPIVQIERKCLYVDQQCVWIENTP